MEKPWNIHHKQDDAFTEAGDDPNIHIFAVEPVISLQNNRSGRKFIACTYEKFWWEYRKMMKNNWPRHFYEVIRENKPCHPYFDLEFLKESNTEVDANKIVDDLICFSCNKLESDFGIVCSEWNVLRLDSSTSEKFSQHLIFRIPGIAFRSNFDVGDFVEELCENPEFRHRLTIHSGGQDKLIVDKAVYTKNRHFRLFQSCKKGKEALLLRSDHCKFEFDTLHVPLSQETAQSNKIFGPELTQCGNNKSIFYASLICNVDDTDINLIPFEIKKRTPNVPISSGRVPSFTHDNFYSDFDCLELNDYVKSLIQTNDTPGHIGSIEYDAEENTVKYSIRGNRYCRNIGRQHKSNNVYYLAYLDQRVIIQRCYDRQSCRDFFSLPIRIPKNVVRCLEEGMYITDVPNEDLLDHIENEIKQENNDS
uniref:DNA-directed primase/polymerase protein-like n=1 Tax=Styela clava TaxID=7725 RepID=UPI00193A88DC|nr:DNA-directed primase/polymerase protein-like [Styela clava]